MEEEKKKKLESAPAFSFFSLSLLSPLPAARTSGRWASARGGSRPCCLLRPRHLRCSSFHHLHLHRRFHLSLRRRAGTPSPRRPPSAPATPSHRARTARCPGWQPSGRRTPSWPSLSCPRRRRPRAATRRRQRCAAGLRWRLLSGLRLKIPTAWSRCRPCPGAGAAAGVAAGARMGRRRRFRWRRWRRRSRRRSRRS